MKKKYTIKQKIEIIDKLLLTSGIAKILARQFWNGTRDTHNIKELTFNQYLKKSLINWFPAANGVISLVKNPDLLKKSKALKNVPKIEEFIKNSKPSNVCEKAHKKYLKQLEREENGIHRRTPNN